MRFKEYVLDAYEVHRRSTRAYIFAFPTVGESNGKPY